MNSTFSFFGMARVSSSFFVGGVLILCMLFLGACGSNRGMTPKPLYSSNIQNGHIKDIDVLPQSLAYYADKMPKGALLTSSVHKAEAEKFKRIFYGAWGQSKAGYSLKTFENTLGSARGYQGVNPWTEAQWASLKANANSMTYPNVQRPAIIVRQTPLREMPTLSPRYSKATPSAALSPFDYFQYSTLHVGLPIYVSHISLDKQWYFIENSIAGGWVQAKDVAFVDATFIKKYMARPLTALIRDKVSLGQAGHAHIGAVFAQVKKSSDSIYVYVPVRTASGMATMEQVSLSAADAVTIPMPITAQNIAKVGDVMMGQLYGWGGHNEWRDCSSTLRDMFTPFGVYLPRNSKAQYNSAYTHPLSNMTLEEKKAAVRRYAKPFLTMIWMPGHIGLYVGEEHGQPAMFHNVWGIRVDEQGMGDDRFIIGRAVVTTLEPGKELANLYNNQTILVRIGGMSTLPGPQ